MSAKCKSSSDLRRPICCCLTGTGCVTMALLFLSTTSAKTRARSRSGRRLGNFRRNERVETANDDCGCGHRDARRLCHQAATGRFEEPHRWPSPHRRGRRGHCATRRRGRAHCVVWRGALFRIAQSGKDPLPVADTGYRASSMRAPATVALGTAPVAPGLRNHCITGCTASHLVTEMR